MQSSTTYGADKTLRTEVSPQDQSGLNLMRALVNDRREDYGARRANRGVERPIGRVAAPPSDSWMTPSQRGGDGGPAAAKAAEEAYQAKRAQAYEDNYMIPQKYISGAGMVPGYVDDPMAMSAKHRQLYLPKASTADPAADAQAKGIDAATAASEWAQSQKERQARELASALGNARY